MALYSCYFIDTGLQDSQQDCTYNIYLSDISTGSLWTYPVRHSFSQWQSDLMRVKPSVTPERGLTKANSQLPNFSGQAWPSIGKFISRMGHSAFIVNLSKQTRELAWAFTHGDCSLKMALCWSQDHTNQGSYVLVDLWIREVHCSSGVKTTYKLMSMFVTTSNNSINANNEAT